MDLVADTLSRLENMRDRSDHQHERHVGAVACEIAHLLGLEDAHAAAIRRAALLHDIGKLVLPEAVLHKAGTLSSPEDEMIKMHTKLGYELLYNEEHSDLKLAAMIALNHHEHADGTGYPNRLKAKDIPIEARIVTLADVYSALRETRAYKQPMAHEKALKIISVGDGRLKAAYFDTDILQVVIASPNEIATAYATH